MTLNVRVTDDRLGAYYRKTVAIADRLGKSLDYNSVMDMLQRIHDGKFDNVQKHVIDCDTDPFVPKGMSVEEHRQGGILAWSAEKVRFHLDTGQQNGSTIFGHELRKKLADQPVLNANILDYLFANQHLIPDEWKKDERGNARYICFWGTIYRDSEGYLSVRYLHWSDGRWRWSQLWLGRVWGGVAPAAVSAGSA